LQPRSARPAALKKQQRALAKPIAAGRLRLRCSFASLSLGIDRKTMPTAEGLHKAGWQG